jgi:hypothetical protein
MENVSEVATDLVKTLVALYASVPLFAIETAAEALADSKLAVAISRLTDTPETTKVLVEVGESIASPFMDKIVEVHRQSDVAPIPPRGVTSRTAKDDTFVVSFRSRNFMQSYDTPL